MASSSSMSELAGQQTLMHASGSVNEADKDVMVRGDFRVDLRTRQATVQGQELRLTQEEFEMLVFLIGHPQSIITPQTRLTTRWGRTQIRQADFLRVLAELRKKLESAEGSHYIRTEPWVVYRFDPHHEDGVH